MDTLYWIDAHNHLQSPELLMYGHSLRERMPYPNQISLVNGTSPLDWQQIADEASSPHLLPAFGLHPWKLDERTPDWLTQLDSLLDLHRASLGEVGLDRWIRNSDFDEQKRVLHAQLELVERRTCPITFHCLKAWSEFRSEVKPWISRYPRPFLLHAYGGSAHDAAYWLEHGAWFSFSPYFLHPHKQTTREIFRQLPIERILVETDSPSMVPPESPEFDIPVTAKGLRINAPSNLIPTYRALAELRNMTIEELQRQVADNFRKFYFPAGGATGW